MASPRADLALLTAAAAEAGEIALSYFRAAPRVWEKADEAGPVTEADLAVDAHLRTRLTAARPAYGWLSEESEDDARRLTARDVFVVDPIDGTRAFVDGQATWAISLAVVRDGAPVAALVALPARARMFAATAGGGATRDGVPLAASTRSRLDGADLLATRWSLGAKYWPGGVPDVVGHTRPSLAYRMALVGEGRFDGMVTFRDTWEWDIAAGSLIATEAGARVTDRCGAPLRFNSPRARTSGVIAAPAELHAALMARHVPRAGAS